MSKKRWKAGEAGELDSYTTLRPLASEAQSFPAGLISHLEREGGNPGEGIHRGRTCLLPPPLPIADFTPSQDVMSLHIAGTEGAAQSSDLGVLLEGCLA